MYAQRVVVETVVLVSSGEGLESNCQFERIDVHADSDFDWTEDFAAVPVNA